MKEQVMKMFLLENMKFMLSDILCIINFSYFANFFFCLDKNKIKSMFIFLIVRCTISSIQ